MSPTTISLRETSLPTASTIALKLHFFTLLTAFLRALIRDVSPFSLCWIYLLHLTLSTIAFFWTVWTLLLGSLVQIPSVVAFLHHKQISDFWCKWHTVHPQAPWLWGSPGISVGTNISCSVHSSHFTHHPSMWFRLSQVFRWYTAFQFCHSCWVWSSC